MRKRGQSIEKILEKSFKNFNIALHKAYCEIYILPDNGHTLRYGKRTGFQRFSCASRHHLDMVYGGDGNPPSHSHGS